jgi:hypothetical protein
VIFRVSNSMTGRRVMRAVVWLAAAVAGAWGVALGLAAFSAPDHALDSLSGPPAPYRAPEVIDAPVVGAAPDAPGEASIAARPAQPSTREMKAHATRAVALWDEMQACANKPGFARLGWSPGGPCPTYMARLRILADQGPPGVEIALMSRTGCLPAGMIGYAVSLATGDVAAMRSSDVPLEMQKCRVFVSE